MSRHIVFEVIETLDFTEASRVLFSKKEDAWTSIGNELNRFIEDHDGRIDINGIEIDTERRTVCMEYIYKKSQILRYISYDINGRFVH